MTTKSIAEIAFFESQYDHFVREATFKLLDPKYKINMNVEIKSDDTISIKTINLGKVDGLDLSVLDFKSNDSSVSNILDFLTKNSIEKCIVKPYDGGSSIGISICTTDSVDLSESLKSRSNGFLVEEFIDGDEFFVPVLLDRAIDVIQVSTVEGFYDYHNKYNAESKSRHIFPAKIPADILEKMKNFAEIAHKVIGCKTLSRSDFIYSESTNRFVMSEINTHPGFTPKSLFPEVCNHYGVDFETLIKIIIYDGYFG
jgi:D-alanine-D-alanine ligase